jgi:hypothetical protein
LDPATSYRTKILDVGAAGGRIYVTRGYWQNISPVVKRYRQGIFRYVPEKKGFYRVDEIPVMMPSGMSLWSYYDLDVDRKGRIWYTLLSGEAHHGAGFLCTFHEGVDDVPFCYEGNAHRGVGAAASFKYPVWIPTEELAPEVHGW